MGVSVGRCACGSVTVRAEELSRDLSACWCEPCRRWQGLCGLGLSVSLDGFQADGPVRVWKSSDIAERAFCGVCGAALWFRPRCGEAIVEPVPGLFSNAAGARLDRENFADRRPGDVRFSSCPRQITADAYAAQADVVDGPSHPRDRMAGGCACGTVRFRVATAGEHSGACHCRTCQQWSGGPFVVVGVRGEAMHVEGATHLLRWSSSVYAERVSCGLCGSKLWYHVTAPEGDRTGGKADDYEICLGAFDDMAGRPLSEEIFIEAKPDGYAFAGNHLRKTGVQALG